MPPAAGDPPHQKTSVRRIPIPANLVGSTLADIDDLAELKLALRVAALLAVKTARRGVPPSLGLVELLDDAVLRQSSATETDGIATPDAAIRTALADNLRRETLSAIQDRGEIRIFINDQIFQQYRQGSGLKVLSHDAVAGQSYAASALQHEPTFQPSTRLTNIFALYEKHIGTFHHGIAEQLRSAEEEYPAGWIEYAFAIAAEHNVRSWNYVNTILRRLVREGLPDGRIPTNEHGKFGSDPEANRSAEYMEQYRRLFGRLPWESEDPEYGKRGG